MGNSLITYSVEEIDVVRSQHHFGTGSEILSLLCLEGEALSCILNMGDKLTDYGVSVFEEGGLIYIVRSHYTLPIVGA